MTQTVPERRDVAVEHTWNAASVFASDADWEARIAEVGPRLQELQRLEGTLGQGPQQLLAALKLLDGLNYDLGHIYVYASMFASVDSQDQAGAAKMSRARATYGKIIAGISFVEPEILAIGMPTLREWLASDAELGVYAHWLDMLEKRQTHVRSAEVEEILGLTADPFMTARNTHSLITDADMRFEPARDATGSDYPITQGTIGALLTSPDREVRRTAWEHYADAHLGFKNTLANCLDTGIKQHVFEMQARSYSSSLEAALSENHIPVAVFHQLIASCRKHLPIWHRYWKLRRKALGYAEMHVYDIKAPLTPENVHVPFEQAMEWISEGMQPLGSEYVDTMRHGVLNQRWVDIYPNQGKRAGAFSSGSKGTHPFIMMSYNNDVFGLSTLAHELGHSMHSHSTWQHQPTVYGDYTIFVAEVASNFNQALVRDYLFNNVPDRDFQIALIEEAMANFHRYFFLMPILAQFELEIHERVERGEPLTADALNTLLTQLFQEGYGDEVVIDHDRIGITWAQFPTHLYSNFYVYQYATGIAGANALAAEVLAGTEGARDSYLQFLRAGNSLYPLEALKLAGVDLTQPEPVEAAFKVLETMIERLETLLEQ